MREEYITVITEREPVMTETAQELDNFRDETIDWLQETTQEAREE